MQNMMFVLFIGGERERPEENENQAGTKENQRE